MRNITRALLLLFSLLLAAFTLFFVLDNQQDISLVILGWSTPALPLAIVVLASLVLGLVIGPILVGVASVRGKRRLRMDR
ncbi:LapA family protein [Pseudomonas sp. MH2]|uniref:LapA family protein n=1 Tax=Pseudomonas machongensis TaxID=3110229 RepID=A0ABU5V910_9PSED|nr:LapA family protein [Pseudomonas sp. MH2]MEA5669850.1 LapA family protein [Pseudomonas sp. MH2]